MWKLGVLFIIVALGSTFGENVIINCLFGDYGIGDLYVCSLRSVTILDPSVDVTFNGTHTDNKTDADVDIVQIYSSNTPFIIKQLFTSFPNLHILHIYDSNLATIVIPPEAQLSELVIMGNNVSRIESNSFRNQTELLYFYVTNSGVTDIDEDAFEDMHAVDSFSLWNNNIHKLTQRTLAPMKKACRMNFQGNSLSIIDEDVFLQNTSLEQLFFGFNQIDQIHPRAFTNLKNSLSYVDLTGNQCVSQIFSLQNDQDWTEMNNSLERCFRFTPVLRNITMELSGSTTVYNEFGDI